MKHRLLLVEDDALTLQVTGEFLESKGYTVDRATNGEDAIALITLHPHQYSLVILDYRLKDKDGAITAEAMTEINPDLYVLIYSGDPSREAVIRSTRNGARGFVAKNESPSVLLEEIHKWCRKFEATHASVTVTVNPSENERLIESLSMVGRSTAMAQLASTVLKLRERNGSVLIVGESGTGKELIARAIHNPKRGPFRAINCAIFASNPQLMASTLFGHTKGSFTGATSDRKGILEEVGTGTVFLDEIYALPPNSQIELLRVLQERVITPVGSNIERAVKFRLIAAAKPALFESVKQGTFIADLFYRIGRTVLSVPPLRERPEDIEPLLRHFCIKWSRENHESKTFLTRTVPFLESYAWPGNIRELENLTYSLLDISSHHKISPEDLDAKFFTAQPKAVNASDGQGSLRQRLIETERQHLVSVLGLSRSLRDAGRRMAVSLTTVLRLIKKHQLDPEQYLISSAKRQRLLGPPKKVQE